jgi:Family of unknown function (DUF6399)/IclR helix-turn-helix domain
MGLWDKSRQIFNCLCANATQSVRRIAQQTGLSKSRVHRLTQAIERRNSHPESWWWETAAGRQWLMHLVVATLSTFGLKRGVGLDTRSAFFARVHLATQLGGSPSALRGVMQALEAALLETALAWEQEGQARGEVREIIGAVDETFLERMLLVFMDLATGSLVLEEGADDRTYATWKALVEERLKGLGTGGLYGGSDRAKALIQLAEQGLECLSMPDFFPVMHEIIKSSSLALGRHRRHAYQALKQAQEALARCQERPHAEHDGLEATMLGAARHTEVSHWEEAHNSSRSLVETLSLTLHPFRIADAAPQTSAQVASHLQATVAAIEGLAQCHQLPVRHAAMTKVRKQLPDLAAVVDFWWAGVRRDVAHAAISPLWQRWAEEALLPRVSWAHHVAHTRCPRRKAKLRQALEAMQVAFDQHALTQCLPPHALQAWQTWATHRVSAFQRASSAVEGRHGALAQLHHTQRGVPKHRYKVWTVLHNFDCRAGDGTTPASRFFRRSFPDLFDTALSHIEALPQPRRRKRQVALGH